MILCPLSRVHVKRVLGRNGLPRKNVPSSGPDRGLGLVVLGQHDRHDRLALVARADGRHHMGRVPPTRCNEEQDVEFDAVTGPVSSGCNQGAKEQVVKPAPDGLPFAFQSGRRHHVPIV